MPIHLRVLYPAVQNGKIYRSGRDDYQEPKWVKDETLACSGRFSSL